MCHNQTEPLSQFHPLRDTHASPYNITRFELKTCAPVAQRLEQQTHNPKPAVSLAVAECHRVAKSTTFAAELLAEGKSLRAENKNTISEDAWPGWRKRFEAIRENPLKPILIEEPPEAGKKTDGEVAEPVAAAKAG